MQEISSDSLSVVAPVNAIPAVVQSTTPEQSRSNLKTPNSLPAKAATTAAGRRESTPPVGRTRRGAATPQPVEPKKPGTGVRVSARRAEREAKADTEAKAVAAPNKKTPRRKQNPAKEDAAVELRGGSGILSKRLQEILASNGNKRRESRTPLRFEDSAAETPKKKAKLRSAENRPAQSAPDKSSSKTGKAKESVSQPPPAEGQKMLIRPSKLGGFGSPSFAPSGSGFSFGASSRFGQETPAKEADAAGEDLSPAAAACAGATRLFGSSPSELIVEGKRQWKPSAKVQEKIHDESSVTTMKKSITDYVDAIATKSNKNSGPKSSSGEGSSGSEGSKEEDENLQRIQRALASQWDSRLRKVDNKFVKTGSRVPGSEDPTSPKKPLLREAKLELNRGLLEKLRAPSQQVQFYEAIQKSMQSADKTPPKLLATSVNPAGTALVEEQPPSTPKSADSGDGGKSKVSNRMPGNIICGICGAVRYYAFILQAKKFGTFSCEPCRKFISRTIKRAESGANGGDEGEFDCVSGAGTCVVPPVVRGGSAAGGGKSKAGSTVDSRCQACWLKLCLIGYNLEDSLYDKLRALLPPVIFDSLPTGASRSQSQSLLPHRGEILEFNRQVPLSRPLFDGFGAPPEDDAGKTSAAATGISSTSAADSSYVGEDRSGAKATSSEGSDASVAGSAHAQQQHVVHERLPNGWTKKAVKKLSGPQTGRWDMFLITPDQKILKSAGDLKLYIAKSGAVIDSNIVNFSLPKKTAKVDKALQKKRRMSDSNKPSDAVADKVIKTEPVDHDDAEVERPKKSGVRERRSVDPMAALPKSRRRETKVPLKYIQDLGSFNTKKRLPAPTPEKDKPNDNDDDVTPAEAEEVEEEPRGASDEDDDENDDAEAGTTTSGLNPDDGPELIGVGTFSIDKESVRGRFSDLCRRNQVT